MARGFLAEIQHQVKVAQREAERSSSAPVREHNAAVRRAEQARKAEERASAQAARAAEADRKRLEREAKAAHVDAMQAKAAEKNSGLAGIYEEIDGLLAATLDVDDYVDLDTLRRTAEHPPFDRVDLESTIPSPPELAEPTEPVLTPPGPPKGLFGRKKKLAEAEAAAESDHDELHAAWQVEMESLPALRQAATDEHARVESERIASLEAERARYAEECAVRDAEVAEHNAAIDTLVTNLGYGTVDAIEEYVSIVLSNSVYPDHFEVSHSFEFEPTTAELRLRTLIPGPDKVPTTKSYKYTKSSDEITATVQSQKASKDRYSGAVLQVALRSLHEVFEADRRGLVRTISLELGTETINPATGKSTYVPFVAVAADREIFVDFDLSAVMPAATLDHLGAAVSKNPYGLVAANTEGIRRS